MTDSSAVLVTGGGGGIGGAVCKRFGREGLFVFVAGRNQEHCEQVASEVRAAGGLAQPLVLDVGEIASIEAAVDRVREMSEETGPIAGLINNAGMAISSPLLAVNDEEGRDVFEEHLRVNFHGARHMVEALLADMKIRGIGRIVNVASSAGLRGYAYVAAYCASKHALVGYTRAAALELASTGVTMSAVCPHYVDSPLTDVSIRKVMRKAHKSEQEARSFFASQNPDGKLVSMEDVAEAVWDLYAGEDNGVILELTGSERLRVESAGS